MRLVRLRSAWHVERVRARLAPPCALILLLALAPAARAHIVVLPEESEAGGWERYTVIVPTETKSPTVRVELKLPNGIDVMGVEGKGWEAVYEPFPIGAAKLRWSGGHIPEGQMVTFDFLVWNPKAPQTLRWVATQWYEDGSSDVWGAAGSTDHPASETVLRTVATGARAHHHHADDGDADAAHAPDDTAAAKPDQANAPPASAPAAAPRDAGAQNAHADDGGEHHAHERGSASVATIVAFAALAISIVALVVANRARGTRDRVQ